MKRQLFQQVAAALWGRDYRSEGARQLGVHLRTFMRWDAGERVPSDDKLELLVDLLDQHQQRITHLLRQCRDK